MFRAPFSALFGLGMPTSLVSTVVRAICASIVLSLVVHVPGNVTATSLITGRIDIDHGDVLGADGRPASATEYTVLDTGAQRLTVDGNGAKNLPRGAKVTLRGQRSGGHFQLAAADGIVSVEPAAITNLPDATLASSANRRVAVILANLGTDTRQPWTSAEAAHAVFGDGSAAEYWNEVSNSQFSLSGDVFGYYTLDVSTAKCDYSGWMTAAKTAATSAGVVLADYTNVMLVFARQSVCSWSGLANVVGRNSFINGSLTTYVTSHELGHNFGVYHAASLRCRDALGARVAYSRDCTLSEYGDPFDVMGGNTHHTSNWHRRQLGFITRADQYTVTASGNYAMAVAEVAGGKPRILRVARPTGDFFYLEWRQPYGRFDAFAGTSAAVNGVMIRIATDTGRGRSKLLDTTPGTTSWYDAPLTKGRTFTDPTTGISITALGFDAHSAQVKVVFGPVPTPTTSPTLSPVPTPTRTASPTPLRTASATPTRTASQTPTRSPSPTPTRTASPTRSPSPTATRSPSATPTRSPSPTATRSPSPTPTPWVDRVPPTTPQGLSVSLVDKNKVRLTWLASTDNTGGVTYQIYRDGQLVRSATALTDVVPVRPGRRSFVVRAVDQGGNTSGFSNSVSVVVEDWRGT
jgi:hypothetical protein